MSELPIELPLAPPEGPRFAKARNVLGGFLALGLIVWLLSGFYQVQTGEVAIVDRLGQYVTESDGSVTRISHGLHYHLPWPIDRVSIVSMQRNYTLQINAFNSSPEEYADFKRDLTRKGYNPNMLNAVFDPYVVTGDKCVVHVELNVQFSIDDPVAWVNSVSHEYIQNYDPAAAADMRNAIFQQIAQRVIVAQVGQSTLDKVLRERTDLGRNIQQAFQDGLSLTNPSDPKGGKIDLGVSIQSVTVSVAEVPDSVKGAYADLITKMANANTQRINAEADAGVAVRQAEGETSTLTADAERYRQNTVQAARGEADRFKQVYAQYLNAPSLSRINLWIDAAKTIYSGVKRIYFVRPNDGVSIFVDPPEFNPNQVKTNP